MQMGVLYGSMAFYYTVGSIIKRIQLYIAAY